METKLEIGRVRWIWGGREVALENLFGKKSVFQWDTWDHRGRTSVQMTPSEGQINVLLFMYCVFPRLALYNKNLKFLQTLLLIPVLCPPPPKKVVLQWTVYISTQIITKMEGPQAMRWMAGDSRVAELVFIWMVWIPKFIMVLLME